MTKRTKQLLSLLLVLIMMVALFPTAVLAASKPTITSQPTAKLGAPGGMVKFTVKATGATSYQWQYRRSSTDTWKNSPADGNRTNTLQVSVEKNKNGYFYRCKVSNSAGSVFSNPAKLNVNKPVIQTHPTAKLAAVGTTAAFTVKANAATKYQWQYKTSAYGTWQNSPATGNKTATLKVAVTAAKDGYFYRCVCSNGMGSVSSNAAKLNVKAGTTYRALLVGNENYDDPLPGCHNDMYAMKGLLTGLKNKFTVTTKPDSTAAQMKAAIKTTFSKATANDVSLFYYSGHGMQSTGSSAHGALVGIHYGNYSYSDYYYDYLTTKELYDALSAVKGRVIVVLDSCHSGALISTKGIDDAKKSAEAFNQEVIDIFSANDTIIGGSSERIFDPETGESVSKAGEFYGKSKFIVFTAAAYDQSSYSVYAGGTPCGIYTYCFVNGAGSNYPGGASSGSIPCSSDKNITVNELYTWVKNRLSNYGYSKMGTKVYAANMNEVIFKR